MNLHTNLDLTSNNGLEIEMYINNNGKIISAFPKE